MKDGYAKVRAMPGVSGEMLRAWRRSRGWDVPDMARQLRRAAGGEPMPAHDSLVRQIRGWEAGDHELSERYELRFAAAFGVSPLQLRSSPSRNLPQISAGAAVALGDGQPVRGYPGITPDWPAWFGVKLASLITLIDAWQPEAGAGAGSLQTLVNEEILMSEAVVPEPEHLRVLSAISRRHALLTLAALPMANLAAPARGGDAVDDMFLSRAAASLTACWHLLRGSDLRSVEHLLAGYLLPLEAAARRPSRHQQPAAALAAQAHRICGIIALHRNQLTVRELYCKRALHFAEVAADPSSHASALISLASTFFYAADPEGAAAMYEQAFRHGDVLPRLQRSRIHAELAVVYGQIGREQAAMRAAAQAEELYPDHPERDPSYLYAEFTPASLILERGLAYVALAGQFPGRGYEKNAAVVFAQIGSSAGVPERIRYEIINHQASTAILLGDLDAFEAFMAAGLDGITLLGSRQRLREMEAIWQRAQVRWPGEARVEALSDGLHQVASARELT